MAAAADDDDDDDDHDERTDEADCDVSQAVFTPRRQSSSMSGMPHVASSPVVEDLESAVFTPRLLSWSSSD